MSKNKKFCLTVLATVIATYLSIAFINLEINCLLWTEDERLAFCYFSLFLSWLTAGLPYVLLNDK